LASYREADACYVLEAGEYILRVGNSSRNTMIIGSVALKEEVVVSRHQHICPVENAFEVLVSDGYSFDARHVAVCCPGIYL
jgi:beta-glucosidase